MVNCQNAHRNSYSRDKMLVLKDTVSDGLQFFLKKHPIDIPHIRTIRTKISSTCSNHGPDELNDLQSSRTSLIVKENSDSEDHSNNSAWRRVSGNRGRGASQNPNRYRFPSGSVANDSQGGEWNQNNQPLWRQRTTSGSDKNFSNRGRGMFNNSRGSSRAGHSAHIDQHQSRNDSGEFYKQRGGIANRAQDSRGRGSFNRGTHGDSQNDNEYPNKNYRHSYHAPSSNSWVEDEEFWNESDWVDLKTEDIPQNKNKSSVPESKPEIPAKLNEAIWIYIDPQDIVRGPFTSNAMSQWHELGDLPMNLQLRRITDNNFTSLENLIRAHDGKNPFVEIKPVIKPKQELSDPMTLLSSFSPKKVEQLFKNFTEEHFPQYGDPMVITESLLKLGMNDIFRCLSEALFLRQKIEEIHLNMQTFEDPSIIEATPHCPAPNAQETTDSGNESTLFKAKGVKKCAMNKGSDGFHFEIEELNVEVERKPEQEVKQDTEIHDLSKNFQEQVKVEMPKPSDTATHKSNETKADIQAKPEVKKPKKNKPVANQQVKQVENQAQSTIEETAQDGWIVSAKTVKLPTTTNEPTGKKKKKNKKPDSETKTQAWEAEFERRRKEQTERRECERAEQEQLQKLLQEQERQVLAEERAEARSAIAALERREHRWQNTQIFQPTVAAPVATQQPLKAKPQVASFAQIQAEQTAEEAKKMQLQSAQLHTMSQKALNSALNASTGWASVAAVNANPTAKVSNTQHQPQATVKNVVPKTDAQPVQKQWTAPVSIWNMDPESEKATGKKRKKAVKANNGHPTNGDMDQLKVWCQLQLSKLPAINSAIDLPTFSALICEMDNNTQVTEFIENSFGTSKKVKKFTQDFMQRRPKL